MGVNTFVDPKADHRMAAASLELRRGTDAEKASQLARLQSFHDRHRQAAPQALASLKAACRDEKNTFEALMEASRVCSLGQITQALFEAGGQYRRNM